MEITLEQATHANLHLYSDVYPYEIVRKISDKTLEIRKMNYTLTNNDMSNQEWEISSNKNNPTFRIRLHKNGTWRDRRKLRYSLDTEPSCYYDYSF